MFKSAQIGKFLKLCLFLIIILVGVFGFLFFAIQPPKLHVPKKADLTLTNLTIWNPGSMATARQTIRISDGVIIDITSLQTNSPSKICDGCYAVPGLIDAHVHTPPSIAV